MLSNLNLIVLGLVASSAISVVALPVPAPQLATDKPLQQVDCSTASSPEELNFCNNIVNGDIIHSVDEFSGHLGRQGAIITDTVGKVMTDEGADGAPVAALGASLKDNVLGGRSNVVADTFANVASEAYPAAEIKGAGDAIAGVTAEVGNTVGGAPVPASQKQAAVDLGSGVKAVGAEADYQFGVISAGAAGHVGPSANAIFPDVAIPGTDVVV